MKSVPSRQAALVGSERTKKECVNSLPFSSKVTDCCPLISRTSPVTPYGSSVVTCWLLLDMPRCIIDMLEPVSKIRLLDIPSISADIVGVLCSNRMGTVSFVTVFSGALTRKELLPLQLSRISLTRGFLFALPSCSGCALFARRE